MNSVAALNRRLTPLGNTLAGYAGALLLVERAGQVQAVTSIDGVAAEYDQRGDFPRVLNGLFPTPVAVATRSRVLADAVVRADSLPRVQAALCAVASTLAARAVVTAAHGRALQAIAQMKQRIEAGGVGDAPSPEPS